MDQSLVPVAVHAIDVPAVVPTTDYTAVRSWLRSKSSSHTRKAYGQDISLFYTRVGKMLGEVTLSDLQDYADSLIADFPESATRRRILYAVKSLFTFAQKQGFILLNVGTALLPPRGKDTLAE